MMPLLHKPHQTVTGNGCIYWLLKNQASVFRAPDTSILFINISTKMKISLIRKDDFLDKIHIIVVFLLGPSSEEKTKRMFTLELIELSKTPY